MRLREAFDRAYVINLKERTDRRKAVLRELEKVRLQLAPGKVELLTAIRPNSCDGFSGIGARGCFLSHLAALKNAKADGLSNVLIIEDDLTIADNFQDWPEEGLDLLTSAPWGIAYFGHYERTALRDEPGLIPFTATSPILTTHFYGVNGVLFDRLIEFLERLERRPTGDLAGGPMALDGAYSTFREQNPDVLTLIASPSLGRQRSSRSDVAVNSWYDKTPLLRQLAGVARVGKEWLQTRNSA